MKLRNKKTGEIIEKYPDSFVINSGEQIRQYNSLAKLNAEWEDYEEPKEYWYIDTGILELRVRKYGTDEEADEWLEDLGLKYDSEEEAEKAVEKLKAWKRLKDKGFRFKGFSTTVYDMECVEYDIDDIDGMRYRNSETWKDLDLLFGGEE